MRLADRRALGGQGFAGPEAKVLPVPKNGSETPLRNAKYFMSCKLLHHVTKITKQEGRNVRIPSSARFLLFPDQGAASPWGMAADNSPNGANEGNGTPAEEMTVLTAYRTLMRKVDVAFIYWRARASVKVRHLGDKTDCLELCSSWNVACQPRPAHGK